MIISDGCADADWPSVDREWPLSGTQWLDMRSATALTSTTDRKVCGAKAGRQALSGAIVIGHLPRTANRHVTPNLHQSSVSPINPYSYFLDKGRTAATEATVVHNCTPPCRFRSRYLIEHKTKPLESTNRRLKVQITLYPDSNFLLHSRDLEQIDWFSHFEELNEYVLRESNPRVVLVEANALQPSKVLAFDYSIMDHRLLGCVRSYSDNSPTSTGHLLTNDGSAYALAKHHDIDAIVVPDDSLLPPDDKLQSKTRALQEENSKLKQAEPSFALALKNDSGQQLESIEIACKDFLEVSTSEVTALIEDLLSLVPERPKLSASEGPPSDFLYNSRFQDQMDSVHGPRRKPQAYQQWLKECEDVLSGLQMSLQLREVLSELYLVAHNEDTRPASNVTVELSVTEPFPLVAQAEEDGTMADRVIDKEYPVTLPTPPAASGVSRSLFDLGGESVFRGPTLLSAYMDSVLARRPDELLISAPRPEVPVRQVRLQCNEWMHGMDNISIRVEVHASRLKTGLRGRLTCTIHASNLSHARRRRSQSVLRQSLRRFCSSHES